MPKTPRKPKAPASDGRGEYGRLENRLVLVAWLNSLFGYERNRDMLKDMADVGEGVDSTGRGHVISQLLSRGEKCLLPESELDEGLYLPQWPQESTVLAEHMLFPEREAEYDYIEWLLELGLRAPVAK